MTAELKFRKNLSRQGSRQTEKSGAYQLLRNLYCEL